MKSWESRSIHYAWVVLTVGTFVVFCALGLARFGYGLVLPAMQTALMLDNRGAGGLATANLIGYLLISLVGGALASRYGARLVISIGMVFVGSGMLLTGTSKNFWQAMIWRLITGIGSGASNVPTMGLMSSWFGPNLRGLATGIAVSGSSIALIFTGPVVPRILSSVPENGWRVIWYFFGCISIIFAVIGSILLKNEPKDIGLHRIGDLVKSGNSKSSRGVELRWGNVYRSPAVWHLGLVYAAFGFSYIIYITFFYRYLVGELAYTQFSAGKLFMIMGWFSLGCGLIWSGLSDRIGRKAGLILVYALQAISFCFFAVWKTKFGIMLSAVIFGLTAWSTPAIMAAACGDVVGPRLASAALGFVTLFFGIGQAFGPIVAGSIADMTGSFRGAFLVAAAAAFLGGCGASLLKPFQPKSEFLE
jgi:sugar phosphate permease